MWRASLGGAGSWEQGGGPGCERAQAGPTPRPVPGRSQTPSARPGQAGRGAHPQPRLTAPPLPQVNLDARTRAETSRGVREPTRTCFDAAQRQVFQLLEEDCYPRFLRSRFYLELAGPSGRGPGEQGGAPRAPDVPTRLPQCA